ncbi:MAG: AI-2E family transporter [Bacilli bacterium]
MKRKIQNEYIYWGITALSVIALGILFYFAILRFDNIIKIIGKILYIFRPLLYGIIIAFILTQSFNFFNRKFTKLLSKRSKDTIKVKKESKIISISISILILLLILFWIFYLLIPKLLISVVGIVEMLPDSIVKVESWLENILKGNPAIENIILTMINDSSKSILSYLSEGILPKMENIVTTVTVGLNGMYEFLRDFTIGIVFSVYLLINKNKYVSEMKKFIYTFLGIKKGNSLLQGARYSYKIFNGFIKGKLLTSVALGIVCYIAMILFKMPYAALISLIVAITNIIPFFGPIIGWVPGVILLLLINPIQALYFTIIIIVLQQIEGNILSPKIVGDSIGLSGFWVLFSIMIFGGIFGLVGMIIGVPIFAIFYHFASYQLKKYLAKKDLPSETADYEDLKYIDETTKKVVKIKSSSV